MGREEGTENWGATPRLATPGDRAVGPAALVGEVAKLLTTDCKTLGWVAACDCTAALCCRFCSDGATESMSLGCLEADSWPRDEPLRGAEARVVTRRGAGDVARGAEVLNIGGEGAGVTTESGDCGGRGVRVRRTGLETASELLWASS